MTAIYYDWEFLEDGRRILPISIGMVADDGREYYAVSRGLTRGVAGWWARRRIRRHSWLMEHVIPHLPQGSGDRRNHVPGRWLFDYADARVKSRARIAEEVRDFIVGCGPDVELWANYGAYDHVALAQLWGPMVALPDGVPMYTHDIQQEARRLGIRWDELPKQQGGEHNALADARHNRAVRRWLAERAQQQEQGVRRVPCADERSRS
ncbi:polyadenylate-specific 3'-exoribonuclease AS [Streptomyces calidiresistens]|uniref:3'-5' exoribonuclease Rv2179c-like domain-containing protein n=1 Tax=Streptomyces calidiresistens TaxID=1485586 RepID=A0A7W3T6F2_9ACTN|nr:3'-5' exoribonuclease [Streptomyces calidiresistens]MBB0231797.1 hypothetical protein [Streptomyces calidiresistens]